MKLKAEHKKAIIEDFTYAIKTMREAQTFEEKLYYFSSTYGVLSRVFNLSFNPQLLFVHQILSTAHATILGRVQAIKSGDTTILLKDDFFEKLTKAVEELANLIKSDKDVYEVLEKIAVLTFVTTGNGYYLLQKGTVAI